MWYKTEYKTKLQQCINNKYIRKVRFQLINYELICYSYLKIM